MKKVGLVVFVLLLVCSVSFSLDISAGVKGAVGYSTFFGSDWKAYMDPWKRAVFLGAGAGGFVSLGFNEIFAIDHEALFLRLGGADRESGTGKELFISNYIAAAVLLRPQLTQFYFLAGPMGLIRVGPGKIVIRPESGSQILVEFADDDLTRFLFAATLGFGYQYPLSQGILLVELRGIYSISKWFNQDIYTDNWTLFAVLVMLGYQYQLGQSRLR